MSSKFSDQSGRLKKIRSLGSLNKNSSVSPKVESKQISQESIDFGFPEKVFENPSPLLYRAKDIYSPNTEYNRKSQQVRYEKGLALLPGNVEAFVDEFNFVTQEVFSYYSNRSPTNKWQVIRISRNIFIRFLRRSLTLFGEINYQLIPDEFTKPFDLNPEEIPENPDVTSNWIPELDSFEWIQESGFRFVFFSNNTPFPILIITGTAGGAGPIERSQPIVIKATPIGDEEGFDRLLIYTIPTSFYGYTGIISSERSDPAYHIQGVIFVPRYPFAITGSYWWDLSNAGEPQRVTWGFPITDRLYISQTIWESNTTGFYLPESVIKHPNFSANYNHSFQSLSLVPNRSYRPLTVWNFDYSSDLFGYYSPLLRINAPTVSQSYGFVEHPFPPQLLPVPYIYRRIVDGAYRCRFIASKRISQPILRFNRRTINGADRRVIMEWIWTDPVLRLNRCTVDGANRQVVIKWAIESVPQIRAITLQQTYTVDSYTYRRISDGTNRCVIVPWSNEPVFRLRAIRKPQSETDSTVYNLGTNIIFSYAYSFDLLENSTISVDSFFLQPFLSLSDFIYSFVELENITLNSIESFFNEPSVGFFSFGYSFVELTPGIIG